MDAGGALFNKGEADDSARSTQMASVIGTEATITGDIHVTGSLRVDGIIDGDVSATRRIQVGSDGRVTGDLSAEQLKIAGRVEGHLEGEFVHLLPEARVAGSVRASRLVMEEGATLDGTCAMTSSSLSLEMGPARLEVVDPKHA
jgi:cytoskeletal protein CcmA (bactofilin family)